MSSSVCAITGKPLQKAVVSRKSGIIFEKSVIQKHLNSFHYCPITNQHLQPEDLIKVRPYDSQVVAANHSTLIYLSKLQDQYNTLVLQLHILKKNFQQIQSQLAHSLAQNQAANQVISRLIKEKQEAQKQIERLATRLKVLKDQK